MYALSVDMNNFSSTDLSILILNTKTSSLILCINNFSQKHGPTNNKYIFIWMETAMLQKICDIDFSDIAFLLKLIFSSFWLTDQSTRLRE